MKDGCFAGVGCLTREALNVKCCERKRCFGEVGCFLRESFVVMVNVLKER
jgi:hypothetical protein